MKKYTVLHIQKNKTGTHSQKLDEHIRRTFTPKNINPELSHNNRQLIGDPAMPIHKAVDDFIEKNYSYKTKTGKVRKTRSDVIRSVNIILSASSEVFYNPKTENITNTPEKLMHDWTAANLSFLQQEFGEKCISAVLHMDEITPHIHATIVPLVKTEQGNKLCAKTFISRARMSELHDFYAEAVKSLGIERGERRDKNREHVKFHKVRYSLRELQEQHEMMENKNKILEDEHRLKKQRMKNLNEHYFSEKRLSQMKLIGLQNMNCLREELRNLNESNQSLEHRLKSLQAVSPKS